jgi:hypothetical protein
MTENISPEMLYSAVTLITVGMVLVFGEQNMVMHGHSILTAATTPNIKLYVFGNYSKRFRNRFLYEAEVPSKDLLHHNLRLHMYIQTITSIR